MNGQTNKNRDVIGDFVELRFVNLPSSSFLRGKVDTGATISSLHCDNYEVNEQSQQITFTCKNLSSNQITMPLIDKQAVKNADGTEYRPVIEMSVKIGEKVLDKVKFNLNNRSTMDSPILIGQNLIKAGNFLIDPKQVSESLKISRLDVPEAGGVDSMNNDMSEIDVDGILQSVVDAINSHRRGPSTVSTPVASIGGVIPAVGTGVYGTHDNHDGDMGAMGGSEEEGFSDDEDEHTIGDQIEDDDVGDTEGMDYPEEPEMGDEEGIEPMEPMEPIDGEMDTEVDGDRDAEIAQVFNMLKSSNITMEELFAYAANGGGVEDADIGDMEPDMDAEAEPEMGMDQETEMEPSSSQNPPSR